MQKKFLLALFVFSIVIGTCVCSCAKQNILEESPTPYDAILSETELEAKFSEQFLGAVVKDGALTDMDGDDKNDYIAIFVYDGDLTDENQSSVGFITGDGKHYNAVNVAAGEDQLLFASNPDFYVENSTAYFLLINQKTKELIRFEVTFQLLDKGIDVKISAYEQEEE